MAGYSRQSVADIIASAIIRAAPVNAEYNAIRDAFAFATGHKHDGSSTEGAYVPLIADTDAKNKVVVDTANNRISVYSEVGGSAVEQLRIQDGAIVPVTDDDVDLGASGAEFKDLYIDGVGYLDSVVITGGTIDNTVIGGTTPAAVTGTTITGTELVGPVTGDVTGNLTGDVTGNVTGNLTGDVTSTGTSTFATVDINGGTIDGTVIGETAPASADFTTVDTTSNVTVGGTLGVTGLSTFTGAMSAGSLTTTGNSTHATVDINGGAIDGTIIGASSAAAGTFTTVTTTGQATLATADINGGTIDGSVIGGATPQAVTGTTITANTGFTGALTGNVTGNVTGNLTGNVTGDVTGDLTGNVTASTGTTTLNDLVVNGTVDFTSTALLNVSDPTAPQHAATKSYVDTADALKLDKAGGTMSGDITMGGNTVTGLGTPIADSDAATKGFVDTSIANVIDAAPAALDTLNELAAALGDDASFSTTVTNSIATKLPLAGGTMTGDIALGANKATSTATPATDDTLTRKGYVDTQDALKLNLSGGTMSGAIAMGTSKITGLGDPTAAQDAATKTYVDTQDATKLNLSGGTMTGAIDMGANKVTTTYTPTDAADLTTKTYVDGILGSATSSAASASAAATSASEAATSASNAATSEANAEAVYDSFDDRYLGDKASAPTVDNDGDALAVGALYFNTTGDAMYVWNGTAWQGVSPDLVGDITPQLGGNLDSNGNDITFGDNDKAIFGAGSDLQIYHDGAKSVIHDAGTGNLLVRATDLSLANDAWSANYLTAQDGGAVTLYHNGNTRLGTTSSGINVSGTVVADALTVDTNANTSIGGNNDAAASVQFKTNRSSANATMSNITAQWNNTSVAQMRFETGSDTTNKDDGRIKFLTSPSSSGGVITRQLIENNGDISFYDGSGNAKFFWDASAERLGIGTTVPRARLHASGVTGDDDPALGTESAPFFVSNTALSYGLNIGVNGQGGAWLQSQSNSSAIAYDILLNPVGGDVGIGTTSPSAKLHVNDSSGASQIKITGGGTSQAQLSMTAGGGTESGIFVSSLNDMRFNTNATEALRINSSGNVGIGTSSPDYRLEVEEAGTGSGLGGIAASTATTGGSAGYRWATGGTTRFGMTLIGSAGSESLRIYDSNNSTERMRIDSSGRVGIGTSSPSEELTIRASVPKIQIEDSDGTNQYGQFYHSAGTTAIQARNGNTDGTIVFQKYDGTTNDETVRIDSGGNLEMTGGGSIGWANFTFVEESGYLYVYNGSTKIMRVDASGNAAFAGDVEANATL